MSISAGFASANTTETQTIIEIVEEEGNLSLLSEGLNITGLNATLSEEGPFTLFAPTDEAVSAIPEEMYNELENDTEALAEILKYHVAGEKLMAADVINLSNITTLQGSNITVNVTDDGRVFVNSAEIIQTDIEASNGVIHIIDAILLPPEEPGDEGPEVFFDDSVILTPGNFTFIPSNNASASYEIENFTDLGALVATGLDFKVSEMGKMEGDDNGNMTEKSLILESIEGIQNNNETQEKWFIMINGEQATEDIGMNPVVVGNKVSFWYALEEGGEPVIEELQYVVNITVEEAEPVEEGPEVLFDDSVILTPGNFSFIPSNNASASYEIDYFTGLGALYASGLSFNASDEPFNATGAFLLESIEGIENNATKGEFWFVYINGEEAPAGFGLNPVSVGDKVSFWYALDEGGEAVIEEASYVANITIAEEVSMPDIIETAEAAGNFSTLIAAIEAANLTDALKGDGPFTVFAPTDDAFADIPEEDLEELLNDTEKLSEVLTYHVVSGKLMAADVVNLTNIGTLQGEDLEVNVTEDGRVFVDGAEVIQVDIEASNGVIHVIDKVLTPPEKLPANWYFFSIPFEAEDPSVETLLAGVEYEHLIYYNSSSRLFEDVSTLEPLKGYWINIPVGTGFNASEQFGSAVEKGATVPPSLKLYQGWNAVGSPAKYTLMADAAFISIADSYAKVIGPWVPDESGSGSYTYVGYNGLNGTLNGNHIGTDIFEVEPYEGYWVYMKEEAGLA